MEQLPFVSCVMPTYNRRSFIPHAIRYFLRQGYENKELIIIDDGTDTIEDLVPQSSFIRYYRLDQKITLGAKLNLACTYAQGEIIANWDDDDWYASTRLQYQVDALQDDGTDVCGINKLFYYDLINHEAYQYIYPPDQRKWLLGSSLCYRKTLWDSIRFADINVGMDGLFVWATDADRVKVLPDNSFAVHMIHNSNISPKQTTGGWWHSYPLEAIQEIMREDFGTYNPNAAVQAKINTQDNESNRLQATDQARLFKNVYACLVHERDDCVVDLIHNLHYHDPGSVILLYNGGENTGLIPSDFPFEQYGVIVHPQPAPATHGCLHRFALDAMQFALDNLSFDTITMVDSDQLCIRPGYTEFLSAHLSGTHGIGMFSSMPERITRHNSTHHVAIQPFSEYELWKPLLDCFYEGENRFAHWTFWPSTVFTAEAVRDLTRLFKESDLLQQIMKHTKIWATEEVILPSLVRLLGYEIVANPCSYAYVRFRHPATIAEVNDALQQDNVYWMHPVHRIYNDPVRKYIRKRFNGYGSDTSHGNQILPLQPFQPFPLIEKLRSIEGWLSDKEAGLLINITLKACTAGTLPQNILEIGSYHGKSTVLFASILKYLSLPAKVYAIDTHDGKLGAEDKGVQMFPPSLESFTTNIRNAGIADLVEVIIDRSYNVQWHEPLALLFIDGLHDYLNVARDFRHFSDCIQPGGYVAFHDYADYFPGVQIFVHEILGTGTYRKVGNEDSLIVIQKTEELPAGH